uniref:hypothetical protein n=1 Tax=uncultured Gimesia sp. TaxID=1678688 RepID=UPI00260D7AB6
MRCLFFVLLNLLSCRGRCVVSLGMIIAKGVGMSMWGFEKRSAELRQDVFCDALHGALMRLVRADMAPNFGAHPEPGGLTLSKIGLKPAGFRGIGFTGARAFTDKMKFPRARRVTRIFEKGTTVSRGFITPSKT